MTKLGIIGVGNMGAAHARNVLEGKVKGFELTALADANPDRLKAFPEQKHFSDPQALIASDEVEAVVIATPHYDHTSLGIAALEAGLHVMVEKPISVHKADCERLIAATEGREKQIFAAMFNQRTDPHYTTLRKMIQDGKLGKINRIVWVITDWFRTHQYYASGGWRATWAGEGGGVLLNQCPHQLDLWQWLFGMPSKVRAFCQEGRFHDIEVEDDVTAYFEYDDGKSGVFITTTGEMPGTNRLEISAENGKVTIESGVDGIRMLRNDIPTSKWSAEATSGFAKRKPWEVKIPVAGKGGQHIEVLTNFADAINNGAELVAPAVEGIHSVELANSMIFSSWKSETVDLPLDGAAYEAALKDKIANSTFVKKTVEKKGDDASFSSSY